MLLNRNLALGLEGVKKINTLHELVSILNILDQVVFMIGVNRVSPSVNPRWSVGKGFILTWCSGTQGEKCASFRQFIWEYWQWLLEWKTMMFLLAGFSYITVTMMTVSPLQIIPRCIKLTLLITPTTVSVRCFLLNLDGWWWEEWPWRRRGRRNITRGRRSENEEWIRNREISRSKESAWSLTLTHTHTPPPPAALLWLCPQGNPNGTLKMCAVCCQLEVLMKNTMCTSDLLLQVLEQSPVKNVLNPTERIDTHTRFNITHKAH